MSSSFFLAFPALLIAAVGVALALVTLTIGWKTAVAIGVGLAVLGGVVDAVGRKVLLPNRPVIAVWLMELWILLPGAIAALAVALLIYLNVKLKPDDASGLTPEKKELLSACLTGITAFLTASFIKAADDTETNWVAPHVREAFHAKYQQQPAAGDPADPRVFYFVLGQSEVEKWVHRETYGGAEGWRWKARHQRAKGVATALKKETSKAPGSARTP
jgi:hypothetical protein